MRPPLSYMPALPPAIGVMAGILLWWWGMSVWLVAICVAIGISLLVFRRHYLAFALFALAVGYYAAANHVPKPVPDGCFDAGELSYSARIERVELSADALCLDLCVDSVEGREVPPFVVQASQLPDMVPPDIGDRVQFSAWLDPVRTDPDFRGQPDLTFYYMSRGVVATAFVEDEGLRVVGRDRSVDGIFADLRGGVLHRLAVSGIDDRAFGFISAVLVGYDDELPDTLRADFRATGVAHALALSGLHVAIVAMMVALAMWPLRWWMCLRKWRFALTILALWIYAALAGMSPSVVRAVTMLSVYLFGLIIERGSNPANSLCVAILLILAIWPYSLFMAGFQLSVAAVCGILIFSRPLTLVSEKYRMAYFANQYLATCLGAVLGCMILTSVYFHTFSCTFLLSNVAVTVLMPWIIFVGACLVVGIPVAPLADRMVGLLEKSTAEIASWSSGSLSNVYLSTYSLWWLGALIVVAALAIVFNNRRWHVALAIVAAGAVGLPFAAEAEPDSEIVYFGAGQTASLGIASGSHLHIFTDVDTALSDKVLRAAQPLVSRRGIDTIVISRKDIIRHGATTIVIPAQSDTLPRRATYMLFTAHARQSVDTLLAQCTPDSIVIGRDVSHRRAAIITAAAANSQIPTINLRRRSWQVIVGRADAPGCK